jgi:hypothetical protein
MDWLHPSRLPESNQAFIFGMFNFMTMIIIIIKGHITPRSGEEGGNFINSEVVSLI